MILEPLKHRVDLPFQLQLLPLVGGLKMLVSPSCLPEPSASIVVVFNRIYCRTRGVVCVVYRI